MDGKTYFYVLTHEPQDDGRHPSACRGARRVPTQGPICSAPHGCVDPPAEAHEMPQKLTGTGAVSLRKPENEHDGMPPFRALSLEIKNVPSHCPGSCINNTATGLEFQQCCTMPML